MADADFNYAATSCNAVRTFRLLHRLPLCVHFLSISYVLDLCEMKHTAGGIYLVALLPWQDHNYAKQLMHAGTGLAATYRKTDYEVDCGRLEEVLFLRLVRQGDAVELAGPHLTIPDNHFHMLRLFPKKRASLPAETKLAS